MARTGAPSIKVDSRAFRLALRKLEGSTRELTAAHRKVAARVAPLIAARTRRRSGRLAAGWKPGATGKAATVRNRVPYAGPQEWGWPTRNIEPTYASRDVVRSQEDMIVGIYRDELRQLIERVS